MPIYEYECRSCGHKEEVLQKMSDPILTDCPHCQKPDYQKLISAAGFQLKGTGWYVTDFKNKPVKEGKSGASESGSSSSTTPPVTLPKTASE